MGRCATAARLPRAPEAVRCAREWLAELWEWGPRLRDAQLVVSELVTNVLLHVDPRPDGAGIELVGSETPTGLRVEVLDFGPGFRPPAPAPPPAGQATGRGLLVVDRLVDRWGVRHDPAGVWFEIDRHPPGRR